MSEKVLKPEELLQAPISDVPSFYESLTDNPVRDMLKGRRPTYRDFIALKRFEDITFTIPTAFFVPIPPTVITRQHFVQLPRIPLVFIYAKTGDLLSQLPFNLISPVVQIGNAHVTDTDFYFTAYNFETTDVTYTVRAYIYELSSKV